jgi:hypothetical protein
MIKIAPDFFTSLFKHNLTIKLLSLALAISVWGFTVISRESTHELILPVEFQNIPSGYSPRNQNQSQVHFTITGPAMLVKSAQGNNSSLILDLKNITAGKTQFNNLEKYLKLHQSVRVTRVSPATMVIELLDTQINPTQGERHK